MPPSTPLADHLLVGIDDTDTIDSELGTGKVSRYLADRLVSGDDARSLYGAVRQQFLVAPGVPYTTHNSAACLAFAVDGTDENEAGDGHVDRILTEARRELADLADPDADPGLCVAWARDVPDPVRSFGERAQTEVVERETAARIAEDAEIDLVALSDPGHGRIGALSAVGLTAGGESGRFIAYGSIRTYEGDVTVETLRADGIAVVSTDGDVVGSGTVETGDWIRPQLRGGNPVLPVESVGDDRWTPANRD